MAQLKPATLGALLFATAAFTLPTATVLAQTSSASYQIPRQSTDGGAGHASSNSYTLRGTIGQPDANAAISSPSYTLSGGFHRAASANPPPDDLFDDGFEEQ